MPNFFQRIQAKLEIYRIEQRYIRNRNRRSTFVSNAVYVDGEYIYQTPHSTGSTHNSSSTAATSRKPTMEHTFRRSLEAPRSPASRSETVRTPAPKRRLHRFASIPGFGSKAKGEMLAWRKHDDNV